MPRNVRNFWLELNVDGCKSRVETGPRSKDGGFSLRILQRSHGGIITAMNISGWANDDGVITLKAAGPTRPDIQELEVKTQR